MLLLSMSGSSNAQEITFVKGGGISYQGKTIQKPKEILPIILQKESPEIVTAFNKFKSNRGAAQVFGFIGGFGIGYSLGSAIGGRKISGGLLAGGAGAIGIALLFGASANNALKQVVDLYNSTNSTKTSFRPFVKNDDHITQIGMNIRF
ncbi:hypothetical protein SAMN05216167_11115 [Spirosoma endophyticum]|uniref:Uncharacterized protein n=2 Tax=Spirosoma endophyticum TaxID=662367 RepID=A0A1I1YCM3_9BACT|nr:hypothetical protein SAMN05216167_11115 [Spirosoma endophyticum]